MKDPFEIIKSRHITERATVLENLHAKKGKPSLTKCDTPKYVFLVDVGANKSEIAWAVREIFKEQKIKVTKVNTILVKGKTKKRGRGRGRPGKSATFKKAVVTLEPGDFLENV